jgi:hypothetical protein
VKHIKGSHDDPITGGTGLQAVVDVVTDELRSDNDVGLCTLPETLAVTLDATAEDHQ